MAEPQRLFFVDLQVGEVPKDFYRENGQREIAYTQSLIMNGKIKYLLVSRNRRHTMITFAVNDESELLDLINGFPLLPYFTYQYREVMDLAETVRQQQSGQSTSAV